MKGPNLHVGPWCGLTCAASVGAFARPRHCKKSLFLYVIVNDRRQAVAMSKNPVSDWPSRDVMSGHTVSICATICLAADRSI